MNFKFYVVKLRTLIVTLFIFLMLIYVFYVCYSVFFAESYGTFI